MLIQFFGCDHPSTLPDKIILSENWEFRKDGDSSFLKAKVPGLVHLDLLNTGLIEDPFYRSNEDSLQWIAEQNWEYQTNFILSPEFLENDAIDIVFEGLDTYADVYLNDQLILNSDNMFRKWKADVTHVLQPQNKLTVYFHSPLKKNREAAQKYNYKLPEQRAFTRKSPYQFGWDWGPRFVTSGIWKQVFLLANKDVKISSTYFKTDSIVDSTAYLSVEIEIESKEESEFTLQIREGSEILTSKNIKLCSGTNSEILKFEVPEARLWWTNGLGEPHHYNLKTDLILSNGKLIDSQSDQIGIRTIELVQNKDEFGSSFYFELNGIPLFIKGANYIPQDNFLSRVSDKKYKSIVESAQKANMNMLRVWGGGIYENDLFYELCDQYGILVWQDFMFAGSMYPGDEAFIENATLEAIDQIKRLRNHASLALWCGNNEVDEAWHNWGWQKQFNYSQNQQKEIWEAYQSLFHETLPAMVGKHDPSRAYWPSSPKIGWGHQESLTEGDSHYWGVWWGGEPFEIYKKKTGRFMSEYGFQGFPPISTLDSVLLPEDKYLISSALRTHEKHNRGFEIIKEYMGREFIIPERFEDYTYVSQLLQAHGMGIAMQAHRRAKPYCMGTLYWQLNDCWPVISWSGIDYYGNWKALHYEAKKNFNDLMISVEQVADSVFVWIVSDKLKNLERELVTELISFDGLVLWQDQTKVEIPANSSQVYFRTSIPKDLKTFDPKKTLLRCSFKNELGDQIERLHYFSKVSQLQLEEPQITKIIKKTENGFEINLQTNKLAKNIYLEFLRQPGHFSENYYDLIPGISKKIIFNSAKGIKNPEDLLKIKTLLDTY